MPNHTANVALWCVDEGQGVQNPDAPRYSSHKQSMVEEYTEERKWEGREERTCSFNTARAFMASYFKSLRGSMTHPDLSIYIYAAQHSPAGAVSTTGFAKKNEEDEKII